MQSISFVVEPLTVIWTSKSSACSATRMGARVPCTAVAGRRLKLATPSGLSHAWSISMAKLVDLCLNLFSLRNPSSDVFWRYALVASGAFDPTTCKCTVCDTQFVYQTVAIAPDKYGRPVDRHFPCVEGNYEPIEGTSAHLEQFKTHLQG